MKTGDWKARQGVGGGSEALAFRASLCGLAHARARGQAARAQARRMRESPRLMKVVHPPASGPRFQFRRPWRLQVTCPSFAMACTGVDEPTESPGIAQS